MGESVLQHLQVAMFSEDVSGVTYWRLVALLALEMCRLILLSRLSCNFMQET